MIGQLLYFVIGIGTAIALHTVDVRNVDMKRCYLDRVQFVRVCWPKTGCWLDEAGVAQCWHVVSPRELKRGRKYVVEISRRGVAPAENAAALPRRRRSELSPLARVD